MSDKPSKVKVGPFTFSITWSYAKLAQAIRVDSIDRFGMTSTADLEITIDENRPLVALQNTLMHEIFHCMVWAWDMPVPQAGEGEMEEQFVSRIDTPFLLLLQENKEVFAWLMTTNTEGTNA